MGVFLLKEQTTRPKYATLLYDVLDELDITIPEYFYLDMVYYLSRGGWCYKSLNSIAKDMKMHRNGVQKMKLRLIDKGLLKKNIKGHIKTTDTYHSVLQQPEKSSHSVTNRNTQYDRAIPLSVTKNNNENNKESKEDFKKARLAAERIRKQLFTN